MKTTLSKIDAADILILTGLLLLGAGLFLWFGRAISLAVVGGILLLLGIAGNVKRTKG